MMGSWDTPSGASQSAGSEQSAAASLPPALPLGPPPRTDSLDQWASCYNALLGFEKTDGMDEQDKADTLDFSDTEDEMLRPEALQRLLSDGLTGLPSGPPAWSAQSSSTMQQEEASWKPGVEVLPPTNKWEPAKAENLSMPPGGLRPMPGCRPLGTPYSSLTIQAPPPQSCGYPLSSAQNTPSGHNTYDSDSDSGSSMGSTGGGAGGGSTMPLASGHKVNTPTAGGQKKGRRRGPADQERKRLKKNAREQRRANKINDQIANMRIILQEEGVVVSSTKSNILSQAIELIRQLRRQITALQHQHQQEEGAASKQGNAPPCCCPAALSRAVSTEGNTGLPNESVMMQSDGPPSTPLPEPYRLLFRKSATPLAIAHLNGPSPRYSSRFIDCNLRFAEVFGCDGEQLRLNTIHTFTAPADEDQTRSVLSAALHGQSSVTQISSHTTGTGPMPDASGLSHSEVPLELILTNARGDRFLVRVSPLKDEHGRSAFLLLTPKAIFRSPPSAPPPCPPHPLASPRLLTAPSPPPQPLMSHTATTATSHQYPSHAHGQMLCPPGQLSAYPAAHVGAPGSGAAPVHRRRQQQQQQQQQQQTHMTTYSM